LLRGLYLFWTDLVEREVVRGYRIIPGKARILNLGRIPKGDFHLHWPTQAYNIGE